MRVQAILLLIRIKTANKSSRVSYDVIAQRELILIPSACACAGERPRTITQRSAPQLRNKTGHVRKRSQSVT